jgi:uncharacterized protein (DUF736 family)
MAAPLDPLLQRCRPKFLPLGPPPHRKRDGTPTPPFLARQETSVVTVLRFASAFQVQRAQAPACHQPSRPANEREGSINPRRYDMANIGSFKKSGNDYTGEIVTMSLQKKSVRIVAEEASENEKAPSHRVFVGRAEIGAAWLKTSKEDREYLSIKLDDPSFAAPIFATLFADEDGKTHNLIWTRARTSNGD